MEKFQTETVYQAAKSWVLEAGEMIRKRIDDPREIDTKSNENDLVTEMDKAVEQFFANKIRTHFPGHFILSEEGFGDKVEALTGTVWIIDPIDGTMNFIHQKRLFSISLAVFHEDVGEIGLVYDVMADVLYHAKKGQGAYKNERLLQRIANTKTLETSIFMMNTLWTTENPYVDDVKVRELVKRVRGVRTYGSAALEFAYLTEAIVDGYVSFKLYPWDFAAGAILYNEVGGVIKQANGSPLSYLKQEPLIAGHPDIVDEVISRYLELK